MGLLIPITDDSVETFTNRFAVLIAGDILRQAAAEQALIAGDVQSGDGTIAFIDLVGTVFDAAR